jgi:hypothetical protein
MPTIVWNEQKTAHWFSSKNIPFKGGFLRKELLLLVPQNKCHAFNMETYENMKLDNISKETEMHPW